MTITFIGHGYVGLVTATVFAELGNKVHVIGHTPQKIENLKKGILPIYEPGLEELVKRNVDAGRLLFALDYDPGVKQSQVVFIAVGTPPLPSGAADLSVVYDVAENVGKNLGDYAVVIVKSTVPIGTNRKVQDLITKVKPVGSSFDIASVPEFLREGQAIGDTLHPDRIVIGIDSRRAQDILTELHGPIDGKLVVTNIESAEMIKYASNAFLATKISFANAIAQLSEIVGADGVQVLQAVGLDKRIGLSFLNPGSGYGGSCFPKDVKALIEIAKQNKYDFALLNDVEAINDAAIDAIVNKAVKMLGEVKGKTIGILGLAFKPDTDDMRAAPSQTVIPELIKLGAKIKVFDPIAKENAKHIFKNLENLEFAKDAYEAAKETDLVILLTEWNEFREMNMGLVAKTMKQPCLIDGRNIYSPQKMQKLGFVYKGVGR